MNFHKSTSRLIVFSILIFLFAISCASDQNNLSSSQKDLVENFEFTDWDGEAISLSDFEGSVVVLDFWETWCGPCLSSFPGFDRAVKEYPDDLVIIAATVGWQDGREEAVEFKNEMDYNFVYVDGSELSEELGIRSIPFKIIIDRSGNIESVQTGSAGADREYEKLAERVQQDS